MTGELHVRRRQGRPTPMRTRRIGGAQLAGAGAPAVPFPGIRIPEPGPRRGVWLGGALSLALHGAIVAALLVSVALAPEEPEEEIVEVKLLREKLPEQPLREEPVSQPAASERPAPVPSEPAPAPKALAERRSPRFAPQAQAVQPQVVNPDVVARAAPAVDAESLEMASVGQVKAPKRIERSAVAAERVAAVSSVAAARPSAVDVESTAGPALRGPIEVEAPAGPSVGPRAVKVEGTTVGTGSAVTFEVGGSSVREGILSDRDVLGSPDGAPLANVNTRVGQGYLKGDGGSGSGPGGGGGRFVDCIQRPAVKRYLDVVHDRTIARWVIPSGVAANQEVLLRFALDAAGSTIRVDVVSAVDRELGASAVQALRSAAPFPPMNDDVRCLSSTPISATFRNPVGS